MERECASYFTWIAIVDHGRERPSLCSGVPAVIRKGTAVYVPLIPLSCFSSFTLTCTHAACTTTLVSVEHYGYPQGG